jgi:hypothetical protein
MRSIRETHTSKLSAKEMRAASKALKVPPPSKKMQLPILKHIPDLSKI